MKTPGTIQVYIQMKTPRVYTSLHTDENPQGLYKFTYR
jgi:hypothetical protein